MVGIAFNVLTVGVFAMAFCLPAGRALVAIALALVLFDCVKRREIPRIPSIAWFMLLFVLAAVTSTIFGIDPPGSWHNLRKLIWFAGIPLFAILVVAPTQMRDVLGAYALGTGVLAVYELIWIPIKAFKMSQAGSGGSFYDTIVSLGSMTDAQRFMVGILISLGFIMLNRKQDKSTIGVWILLVFQVLALLLTFKRGSLLCLLVVLAVFVLLKANWRYMAALVGVAVVLILLPPVRARLSSLGSELDSGKGGRVTMWFKIAPVLHKEYPWLGIGWRAMSADLMQDMARKAGVAVEPNRNHLHSNIAEVLVETGWIGFFLYALWMIKAIADSVRFSFGAMEKSPDEEFGALILLMMLLSLLLNGLVEFNFADGELVVIYAMIMGCVAAGLERMEFNPPGIKELSRITLK